MLLFRKNGTEGEPSIDVLSFKTHDDVPDSTLLEDMYENDFFIYDGDLDSYQLFGLYDHTFTLIVGDFSDDTNLILACSALIVYRPTESKPQFSSSRFRWFHEEWWRYYPSHRIYVTYNQWKQTVISTNE